MAHLGIDQQQKRAPSKWLRALSKEARLWVMLTIAIGFISGLLLILQMYFLAHIAYAAYIKQSTAEMLVRYFVRIIIIVVIRAGLGWLKEIVSFQTSKRVRTSLRQNILEHINQLGPVYAGKLSTSHLVSATMEQVEGLHDFFVYYLPQMNLAILIPIAILVFVFPVSIVSGFILLVCAPLIPFFMALVGMGAASLHQKHFQSLSRMSLQFLDTIQGLVTLKLLGRSKLQADLVFKASNNYRLQTMKVLRVAFLSSGVLEMFAAASIALLAIYLGMGFIDTGIKSTLWWTFPHMTLQGALFILLLAPEFFLPLRELGTHYHARAKAIGAALEIAKVLELKPEVVSQAIEKKAWSQPSSIVFEFKAATVSYHNGAIKALDKINLSVQAGEKVAIVGPSGAGKTTLLNALLKFVNPSEGVVLANHVNIAEIDEKSWYQTLSWLGQNATLFHGSIRENLKLANLKADDQAMMRALVLAQLDDVILNLEDGLDTLIGEQHMGLSGGQAQRLALARVYLKDAPLLLLDEPISSLDADHEEAVFQSLTHFWKNKTVLLLTHRLNFLEKMDRILVLDGGQIVQSGNLTQLLSDKTGLFYQLYYVGREH